MAFDTVFDLHQRLADLTEALCAVVDRLEAAIATRVQVVDAAGEPRADGYPSMVAWLRQSCRMLASRASERVTVARQLRRLPEAAARFTAGSLGYSTVKVVARVVKTLTDADTGKAEPILLEVAGS